MTPKKEHPNTKFTADVREQYLQCLREGSLKYESARTVGVSYRTVERHMADDEDFKDEIRYASGEARERKEKVLSDLADQGDLGAIKMWLVAHDRSTYGDKQTLEIDATDKAIEMSQSVALARVAELQKTLEERRQRLIESGDVIDLPSEEVSVTELSQPPETADVTDVSPPPKFEI